MPFWGTERFRMRLADVVVPGEPARVKQGAYELSLGGEVYLSGEKQKHALTQGSIVNVPPGTTALLLTMEVVTIPHNAVGFISLKSRAKLPGLINVSGFHVDPGFQGRLVFTVYNAGVTAQTFTCGDALFLLWLADMDPVSDPYRGPSQLQNHLSSELIGRLSAPGISPADLHQKIEKMQEHRTLLMGMAAAMLLGVVVLILEGFPFRRIGENLGDWIVPARTPSPAAPSGPLLPAPSTPVP